MTPGQNAARRRHRRDLRFRARQRKDRRQAALLTCNCERTRAGTIEALRRAPYVGGGHKTFLPWMYFAGLL